jgi:hypothetical protein
MAEAPDVYRKVLSRNLVLLKNHLDLFRTELFDRLIQNNLITKREKQTIEAKPEAYSKVEELLEIILRKDDEAIATFLDALRGTHPRIYSKIRDQILEEDPTCDLPEGIVNQALSVWLCMSEFRFQLLIAILKNGL